MNILLMTTHLNAGGITSYLLTLARDLIQKGHGVMIVSGGGQTEYLFEESGVKVRNFPIKVKSELHPCLYMSLRSLATLIKDEKIDVIHSQTRVTQVLGQHLKKWSGCPVVSTCHGFFKKRLGRRLFPCWGDKVIAISPQVRNHLINDFQVPALNIRLIVNGLNCDDFPLVSDQKKKELRAEFGIPDEFIVGIVARLSDVKGHEFLIKAMPKVLQSSTKIHLVIVGEGKEGENLKDLVRQHQLENHVSFFPAVNQTRQFLSMFDLFVMPSLQEGLGLSVMEAQAAGIPVIASRVGGLPSLIEHGRTGLLVEPSSSDELAEAIIEMMNDPGKRAECARQARCFIKKEFSADQMGNETIKVYQEAREGK